MPTKAYDRLQPRGEELVEKSVIGGIGEGCEMENSGEMPSL